MDENPLKLHGGVGLKQFINQCCMFLGGSWNGGGGKSPLDPLPPISTYASAVIVNNSDGPCLGPI